MTNVLLFEPYLFDRIYGNMRYIKSIIRWHHRDRHTLRILSPRDVAFLGEARDDGIVCDVLPPPDILLTHGGGLLRGVFSPLAAAAGILRYTAALHAYLRAERFDLVQCHSIRAVLTIGLAARLTGTPILWYVKGQLANPLLDAFGFVVARRILFQGGANRDRRYPWLRRRLSDKTAILGNGIDLDDVAAAEMEDHTELRRELNLRSDRLNVVAVGQVSPAKGLHILVDACARLHGDGRAVALYVVGDHGILAYESYKAELEATITRLSLPDIRFLGWRADVYQIVAVMDALIHPSLEEGVPKAVIEAMALGKPVIATRVGSIPDLIEDGRTGLIVEPNAPDQLARAMMSLADQPASRLRLGQAARAHAWNNCHIRDNIQGLEGHWHDLTRRTFTDVTESAAEPVSRQQRQRMVQRYIWARSYCEGRDVLEIACGAGCGLGIIAAVCRSLNAGDIEPDNLATAKRVYGDWIAFRHLDAHDLPYPDRSLDVVIIFEALYYMADPARVVEECARVLRPGGHILITTANKDLYDFNPCPSATRYHNAVELSALCFQYGLSTQVFGGHPVSELGPWPRRLRPIKALAARWGLIPRTLRGKRWLKRIIFGALVPLSAKLRGDEVPAAALIPITGPDSTHQVIYAVVSKAP